MLSTHSWGVLCEQVEAYRDEARIIKWGMGITNAPLAPQYLALSVEYYEYCAAARSDFQWPCVVTLFQ